MAEEIALKKPISEKVEQKWGFKEYLIGGVLGTAGLIALCIGLFKLISSSNSGKKGDKSDKRKKGDGKGLSSTKEDNEKRLSSTKEDNEKRLSNTKELLLKNPDIFIKLNSILKNNMGFSFYINNVNVSFKNEELLFSVIDQYNKNTNIASIKDLNNRIKIGRNNQNILESFLENEGKSTMIGKSTMTEFLNELSNLDESQIELNQKNINETKNIKMIKILHSIFDSLINNPSIKI
jgi:hypothetical protein